MTVICNLTEIQNKWMLTPARLSQNFYNTMLMFILQVLMLSCVVLELVHEEHEIPGDFKLLIVKVPCAVALHLCLSPEVH